MRRLSETASGPLVSFADLESDQMGRFPTALAGRDGKISQRWVGSRPTVFVRAACRSEQRAVQG